MLKRRIYDIHMHPYVPEEGIGSHVGSYYDMVADFLLSNMSKAGVEKAVVLALDLPEPLSLREKFREDDLENAMWLLYKGHVSNRDVWEIVRRGKGRLVGFGSVNPVLERSVVEARLEEIERYGLRGIKLIPTLQLFMPCTTAEIETVLGFAEEKGLPLLVHSGCDPGPWEKPEYCVYGDPSCWVPWIKKYDVVMIFAHMGYYSSRSPGVFFRKTLELVSRGERLYVDTSAVWDVLRMRDEVMLIRRSIGFGKVLFGSDFPVVVGVGLDDAVRTIAGSPLLDEWEKELVLWRNAAEILGL